MVWAHEVMVAGARPCPFCGSVNVTAMKKEPYEECKLKVQVLRCSGCDCTMHGDVCDDYEGAFESALEAWNRRA